MLTLRREHVAQARDVVAGVFAVAGRGPGRFHQALRFQKTQLGDRDVGKLVAQVREDVANAQQGTGAERIGAGGVRGSG